MKAEATLRDVAESATAAVGDALRAVLMEDKAKAKAAELRAHLADLETNVLPERERYIEETAAQGAARDKVLIELRTALVELGNPMIWTREQRTHGQALERQIQKAQEASNANGGNMDRARAMLRRAQEEAAETRETIDALEAVHIGDVQRRVLATLAGALGLGER